MENVNVSGVPILLNPCVAVANSRLYIAIYSRTGLSYDLAGITTAVIRLGRGRHVTKRAIPTKEIDAEYSENEGPHARPRTSPPAFVNDTKTVMDNEAGQS